MPLLPVISGAIQAVYIGDSGSSSKMKRYSAFRTAGAQISEVLETEYTDLIDDDEQSGYLITEFDLTFLNDSMTRRVLRRLSVTETDLNKVHGSQKYDLLLLFPIAEVAESFLFLNVYPTQVMNVSYQKGGPSAKKVTFKKRQRDASLTAPYTQDTIPALKAILGSPRSPI